MKVIVSQLWNSDMTKYTGSGKSASFKLFVSLVVKNQDQHDLIHNYHNTETNLDRLISCRSHSRFFIGLGIKN